MHTRGKMTSSETMIWPFTALQKYVKLSSFLRSVSFCTPLASSNSLLQQLGDIASQPIRDRYTKIQSKSSQNNLKNQSLYSTYFHCFFASGSSALLNFNRGPKYFAHPSHTTNTTLPRQTFHHLWYHQFQAKSSQFLPHLTVWSCLQFTQMSISQDLVILCGL